MLIIVESPTKAKKIQSILKVKTLSTVGHFKDLPDARIGVDLTTYELSVSVSRHPVIK